VYREIIGKVAQYNLRMSSYSRRINVKYEINGIEQKWRDAGAERHCTP